MKVKHSPLKWAHILRAQIAEFLDRHQKELSASQRLIVRCAASHCLFATEAFRLGDFQLRRAFLTKAAAHIDEFIFSVERSRRSR